MDYGAGRMIQAQEDANTLACYHAFIQAFPQEPVEAAELCDSGSWSCPTCPWRGTAMLHANVLAMYELTQ